MKEIVALLVGFWNHLNHRHRRQSVFFVLLIVCVSLTEIVSLGAVIPFLNILIAPNDLWKWQFLKPIFQVYNVETVDQLRAYIVLFFIMATLATGVMRLLNVYISNRFSYSIGTDFSYQVYRRTLYQPYRVHIARNTSEILVAATTKIDTVIAFFLSPVVMLISNSIIFIGLFITLLMINAFVTVSSFLGFSIIYVVVTTLFRKKLNQYSQELSYNSVKVAKTLQEGLGGIRDILINGSQEVFCNEYKLADKPRRQAQAASAILGTSPRYALEALGLCFLALFTYWLTGHEVINTNTITSLGALALGAQRMLPLVQQGYMSYTQIIGNRHSLHDALELLNQPIDESVYGNDKANITFLKTLSFRNINFRYTVESPIVLNSVSLEITKGTRIGFMGPTGSGKSTLIDIIMGLLEPTSGSVEVDGIPLVANNRRSWQHQIAHVPQSIYLSDVTIAENIAFGVPSKDIDLNRVKHAAKLAQIGTFIESQSKGYQTLVGERGVRLSGGQRQRIGIARALYKNASVIVFDEATSALDNETEKAVIDAVETIGRDITIIMIAHRLTTLQRCDVIFELSNGQVVRSGSYATMVG